MGKKRRLPLHYALQPMPRWMVMPPQSLVFPGCPSNKNIVQMLKNTVNGRFVEATVVVDPSPYHGVGHSGQIIQRCVCPPMYLPLPHGIAYRFRGFVADCRSKCDEKATPAVLRSPRPKRKTQEIKLLLRIFPTPIIILAVNNLCLLQA